MRQSSINVSLTYLRGLEVPELNEEDMPFILKTNIWYNFELLL